MLRYWPPKDYVDSCAAWFESNERAMDEWEVAFDEWDVLSDEPSPEIDDFKDDSEYQALWAKASRDLDAARTALELEH